MTNNCYLTRPTKLRSMEITGVVNVKDNKNL